MSFESVQDNSAFTGIRLPTTARPSHYAITLEPEFKDCTFQGQVVIDVDVFDSASDSLILHANNLKILAGFYETEKAKSPLSRVTYGSDTETIKCQFADLKNVSTGKLTLLYSGELNDRMKGFYRTVWSSNPEDSYAVVTQCEPIDARQCVPCWDEPAFKAKFTMKLVWDKEGYSAFSNIQPKEVSVENGKKSVLFETTPIMSSYLLACSIGPYEGLEAVDKKNRKVGVYTMPGKKEQGRYALDVAVKGLNYYEEYFKIDYPLTKMDLLAIPDFCAGAMENWGLVTYRETCLLVDPKNTSISTKQYVALVVAHELAHQWFGNLVTMEWWTHLWLNEGFANFMEYLCVDSIFPEYEIWNQFVMSSFMSALELDALNNSHPIEVPIAHPSEIDEIFDAISYEKGSSVIRMLYNYIGDAAFRDGMKNYMEKFAYKNAQTEDLWDSLGESSNKPVRKIMSGWVSQKGFPWLSLKCEYDGDDIKLHITQNKFTADGKVSSGDAETQWMIPISITNGADPSNVVETLMEGKQMTIEIKNVGQSWIKLNPGSICLYRTAYPPELALRFEEAIKNRQISAVDRLGLLSDASALCKAGKLSSVDLLKFLSFYKDEEEYVVWSAIDATVSKLHLLLANTACEQSFNNYVRCLYARIFSIIGWDPQEGEKDTVGMLRALVINQLISSKDEQVIEEARKRYKTQQEGGASIIADLRKSIYKAVSKYGDDAEVDSLYALYKNSELHEEQERALIAIAASGKEDRAKRALAFAMSDQVKNQHKITLLCAIGSFSQDLAWKNFQEHFEFLSKTYSGFLITRLVKFSTQDFTTDEKAAEIEEFFKTRSCQGFTRVLQQSLEKIHLNASWLRRDSKAIESYLS